MEMVFEFDSVRNFSAMILHTNNMFSKDVQVSSRRLPFSFYYTQTHIYHIMYIYSIVYLWLVLVLHLFAYCTMCVGVCELSL